MVIKFRQVEEKDFAQVHSLILRGWYFAYSHLPSNDLKLLVGEYFSDKMLSNYLKNARKGKGFFLGAFDGASLIGVCIAKISKKSGEIESLYVEPSKLRQGTGSKLIGFLEDFLRSKEISSYFTFVNMRNSIGLNFYKKLGFVHLKEKDKDDEFEKKVLGYFYKRLNK